MIYESRAIPSEILVRNDNVSVLAEHMFSSPGLEVRAKFVVEQLEMHGIKFLIRYG